MSRLPLLPKWVLPPTMPSIYYSESSTALEMVAKCYGAMRKVVEDYNTFVDEINEEINSFTSSSNEEIENFKQSVDHRLACKFKDLDALLAKITLEIKKNTDAQLEKAFSVFGVTVRETGENIILSDATDEKIRALSIYGKTMQRWDPVLEYPADLKSVGDSGSVTVKISNGKDEQLLPIATPEGLPGIPVSEGGNYTDANGQSWICDEIDLKRGVYIKRTNRATVTKTDNGKVIGNNVRFSVKLPVSSVGIQKALCSHLHYEYSYGNDTPHFYTDGGFLWMFLPISCGTNAAEITVWLSKNPVDIIYQLAEPIERPLTLAELAAYKKLHTYMPDTTISNGSGAGMLVEYVAITQKYLENRITDQAVQITTQLVNEAIANGKITVAVEYNEETEEVNIVVGGET